MVPAIRVLGLSRYLNPILWYNISAEVSLSRHDTTYRVWMHCYLHKFAMTSNLSVHPQIFIPSRLSIDFFVSLIIKEYVKHCGRNDTFMSKFGQSN